MCIYMYVCIYTYIYIYNDDDDDSTNNIGVEIHALFASSLVLHSLFEQSKALFISVKIHQHVTIPWNTPLKQRESVRTCR